MSARLIKMTSNSRASAIIVTCKRYFVATTNLNYAGNKQSSADGREGTKTKDSKTPPKREGEQDKKPKVAKKEGEQDKKAPVAKPEEKSKVSGQKQDAKK